MQKILLYSGWALAVVGGVGAFVFYRQVDSLQTENKALSGEILALSQARKAEAALATKTIALPRESAPAPKDVVVALPDTFNLDKVVGDMIQDLSVDTEPVFSEKDRTRNKEEVAESDEQIARRNAMKQRYLESRFTGLFEALNLSPERVAELQGILQSHAEGVFDIRRMQREGLITEAEANVQLASIEGKLQSQLGSVLSPTELAQYQDYEATEPERRMTRTLSLQIKNHSNMAPALRNKLVASFHNQLLIETENPENGIPLDPFTRSNVAYANTLEQLSGELSPQEYAQAQAFMEERLRMQSAMLERISTWDVNRFNGGGPWGYEDLPGGGRRGSGGAGKPKP